MKSTKCVTVTKVGKPGTQGWLSMDAKAGDRNIKVSPIGNISVGDKIRLDIETLGHGIEWVTVKKVGTQSVRNTFRGPLAANEDPGTGLDLTGKLKFNHSSNLPFSVWGTGISFTPASAFAHSSNEPVLPLGTGITLDQPLSNDHDINSIIRDEKVTTAGYQGTPAPDQWFGGPALSTRAGNMVLRDAVGNVVDGLNYGLIVDPWAAEGYQASAGTGENGCVVPAPGMGGGGPRGAQTATASQPNRSAGRYPDGTDTDSNCRDFLLQNTLSMLGASSVGSTNIKVPTVANLTIGQKVIIDKGANSETAIVALIGTAGGTTVATATTAGATVIPVASVTGFTAGQTITIDNGANLETAVVASVTQGRQNFGGGGGNANASPASSITLTTALKKVHSAGVQVSGTGLTLASPLTMAHESGTQIASNVPTPGEPNQFIRRP